MAIFKKRESEVIENEDVLLTALLGTNTIDRESVMQIPIVQSNVNLICNKFASIPIKLYKETTIDGKKYTEEVNDVRVSLINDDTKDTLDGFQFKKALCEDYLLGKGGYAYIKKINNVVKGLYYIQDNKISIIKNTNSIYKSYSINVDGVTYNDYDFIKLLRNSKDGASGIGLVKGIGEALTTSFKRLQYEKDLIATGGSRKGFLKSQKHLDEKSMKALKNAWNDFYSGNANTVILNDGLEFQEASNNSQQNELNAKNITFIEEINRVFNVSANHTDFIKNAVEPILKAFVSSLNKTLLLEKEKSEYYFDYDISDELKGSLNERYQAYATAIQNGFKTRNEIRYLENDNFIKGLDVINLSLGSVLLDTNTGNIYTPNTNQTINLGEKEISTQSVDIKERG